MISHTTNGSIAFSYSPGKYLYGSENDYIRPRYLGPLVSLADLERSSSVSSSRLGSFFFAENAIRL